VPKLICNCLHFSGNLIQNGNDLTGSPLRYLAGGGIKLVANSAEWAVDLTRAVLDTAIYLLKGLGAFLLDIKQDPICVKESGNKFIAADSNKFSRLMEAGSSTTKGSTKKSAIPLFSQCLPRGFVPAGISDIPVEIMARRNGTGFTGEKLKLHQEEQLSGGDAQNLMVLRSDPWSALRVVVYKKDDEVFLYFHGTDAFKRPGTLKSCVNIGLGIRDRAQDDADILVKAFIDKFPGKVTLIGHSLGSNLATGAALKYNVRAVNFNGLGLPVPQRIDLNSKILAARTYAANTRISNENTGRDLLTRLVQPYLTLNRQVGTITDMQGKGGHGSNAVTHDKGYNTVTIAQSKSFHVPDGDA